MNKLFATLLFTSLFCTNVTADFSQSQAGLHPLFPVTGPFIIEISGTWPTDCHPGEQKPVVTSFDGQKAEIDFEIIILHITCNIVDTPYRVLVDMSGVVRATKPRGDALNIQVNFGGSKLEQTLKLVCPDENGCARPPTDTQRSEPGFYSAPGLANQGLLLVRQNAVTGIFPLVYDQSGNNEWLFGGSRLVEDSFFAEIFRLSGGDCFGCEPTSKKPDMASIGHISVLVDRADSLQVKVNDGLFSEYRRIVFGYQVFKVGPAGEHTLIDLSGRWGVSENHGTNPPLGDLTVFFPGAFDLVLEDIVTAGEGLLPDGQVSYRVDTPIGETLGQLVCKGQTRLDDRANVCEFIDPTDAEEPLFLFYQDGPASLSITFARALIAIGTAPGGKAVRLD